MTDPNQPTPYGAQQQPEPHAQPAQPVASYGGHEAAAARPAPNPLGVAALVVLVAQVVIGFGFTAAQAVSARTGDYIAISMITVLDTVVTLLLLALVLVLGVVALARRGASRTTALLAIGGAGVSLLGMLSVVIYPVVAGAVSFAG